MSLKDTYKHLRDLLANITTDLEKSENGNKAASQRVRTGTVKLEKVAKLFRKESISTEKKTKGQKKPAKTAAKKGGATKSKAPVKAASKGAAHKVAAHKGAAHKGAAAKGSSKTASKSKSAVVKAKPKAKAARASFKSRPLSVKKQTAKLPKKR
ncbi:MAG: histone [Parachlamydiaceae bacterium]|nr:histone [Parachlamydiaceae bacterium]